MKKISLISVYNKQSLVDEMKKSALTQKNVEVDLVLIDNSTNQFSSAAKALNHGTTKSTGDVLVFLHQDIEFLSDECLEYVYDFAVSNPEAVFGVAGVPMQSSSEKSMLSNFHAGPHKVECATITKPEKAFTLDECLIACNKKAFEKLSFDEVICDGWHLYGADLCLQAQAFQNMTVYAIPLNVWHKSNGNADKSYYKCQNKLGKKYKKYFKVVKTTNGWVYTNAFKRFWQSLYRKIRYKEI